MLHEPELQHWRELPVVLVLGIVTSATILGQLLPCEATDALKTKRFQLVQPLPRLERMFGDVLLSEECCLFFGYDLLQDLDDHFMLHDFTVPCFQQGLQASRSPTPCPTHHSVHLTKDVVCSAVPNACFCSHIKGSFG